ncbi:MAG: DUF6789 family protein, partial [Bacillota bacterium]
FLGMLIFGHRPSTLGELILSTAYQYFFLGVLGIIFAYLIPIISSRNYWLKGIVFGGLVWFVFISVFAFFNKIKNVPLNTGLTCLAAGIVWGCTMGYVMNWLSCECDV